MKRELARFLAKTKSGKKYMIIQYQEESSDTSQGSTSFTTITGLAVNYVNPKTFQIVETGEYVQKA